MAAAQRRPRPLQWQDTDVGQLPDCGPCLDHLFTPMLAEAIASCAIESSSSAADLTRRFIEHYHVSGHRET